MAKAPTEVRLAALEIVVRDLLWERENRSLAEFKARRDATATITKRYFEDIANVQPLPNTEFTEDPQVRMELVHLLDEWVEFYEDCESASR